MTADGMTAFIEARLAEEQPAEVCGCYDTNHRPPCVPQPYADRKRREIASIRRILARHHAREDGKCAAHPYIRIGACPELRDLAAIWETDPAYRAGWKP